MYHVYVFPKRVVSVFWSYIIVCCYLRYILLFYKMPRKTKSRWLCERFCLSRICRLVCFCSSMMTQVLYCGQMVMYIFTVALRKLHANAAVNAAWGEGCRWGWHHLGIGEEKSVSFAWRTWSNAAPFKDVMHDNMTTRQAFGKKPPGFRCSHLNVHMLGYFVFVLPFIVSWSLKKYWRLSLCLAVCLLNWTANQSCFSSLALLFRRATERGRCPECKSTKGMFAADFSAEMEQKKKQGGMWATRDPNRVRRLLRRSSRSAAVVVWFTRL